MTSLDPVRILCAANGTYAAPLCVMLISLVINHPKDRPLEIYVLATNIPDEDRRKIEASLRQNRPAFNLDSLRWLSPDLKVFQDLHVDKWAEIEVYARLLAPRILPENVDKVLYLDSDMVILSDLSPLYDLRCEHGAVHAVRDQIGYVSRPLGVFNYKDLGIPAQTPYFNSGVLLINLRYWRDQNIADRVIEYLRRHQEAVHFWDQGGLNAILHDAWTEIEPAWNQTRLMLSPGLWKELGGSMAEWRRATYHPKIVHYSGKDKPWATNSFPGYSYFFKYLRLTSYQSSYKGHLLEQIIGFRLNYFIWRLPNLLRDQKNFLRRKLDALFSRQTLGF